jgi:protein-S-isoprenylcysteine O-methyltransferase Ste14
MGSIAMATAPRPAHPDHRRARGTAAVTVLDIAERLMVLALYGWLVGRILADMRREGHAFNLILLVSEGLVVVFMLLRRPAREVSRRPADWALALGATCAPLLVAPGTGTAVFTPRLASAILAAGLVVQLHAKLTLGRSIGCIPAHRGLKVLGPYRIVRHPMYAGYLLVHLGFLAVNASLYNVVAYTVTYAIQVPRLLAEERLLKRDPDYLAYCTAVPSRLIPGLF